MDLDLGQVVQVVEHGGLFLEKCLRARGVPAHCNCVTGEGSERKKRGGTYSVLGNH